MSNKRSKLSENIILISIILMAAVLRFYGSVHATDVPYPSEVNVLKSVEYMTSTASLDTNFFSHPDTVLLYCVLVVINAVSFITTGNTACGSIHSIMSGTAGSEFFSAHMAQFLTAGRCVNVVFSLITIFVCYLTGNRFKPKFGLLAALFIALFPSYNIWSGLMLSDTCLMMFMTIAVYFAICGLQTGKYKYLVLTTTACALATVQKYPGFISFSLVIYLILNRNYYLFREKKFIEYIKSVLLDGVKFFGIFIAACMVSAPALVIHFPKVAKSIIFESRSTHLGADGLGYFGNLWFYLKVFINQSGFAALLGSILGGIFLVKNKARTEYIPILLGFFMMLVMSKLGLHWERWSLMFHTSALMLCAYAVVVLFKTNTAKIGRISAVILSVSFILVTGTNVWVEMLCRIGQDTRTAGTEDIKVLNINKDNTYYESYTILSNGMTDSEIPENCEYIMVSSYNYDRYNLSADRYPERNEFYNRLDNECEKVYEIEPWNKNRIIMDASIYTKFDIKTGLCQFVNNCKDICYYYSSGEPKNFGPTVKVYRIEDIESLRPYIEVK